MQQAEKDFLLKEKKIEGKNNYQAYKEIGSLEEYQNAFKILKKMNIKLNKEVEKLQKKLKDANSKVFKLKFEKDSKGSIDINKDKRNNGSINQLIRIVNYMKEGKEYSKSELAKQILITVSEADRWLNVLIKYKLLPIKTDGKTFMRLSSLTSETKDLNTP
jgi:hypothetical protein